eukprot:5634107-Pyramimonas_sp.AAC.1
MRAQLAPLADATPWAIGPASGPSSVPRPTSGPVGPSWRVATLPLGLTSPMVGDEGFREEQYESGKRMHTFWLERKLAAVDALLAA